MPTKIDIFSTSWWAGPAFACLLRREAGVFLPKKKIWELSGTTIHYIREGTEEACSISILGHHFEEIYGV